MLRTLLPLLQIELAAAAARCESFVSRFRQPIDLPQDYLEESSRMADSIFDTLRQAMELDFNFLFMASNFAMSIPKKSLTAQAFREFTRPVAEGGLWQPSMQGVSFNPRVLHNNEDPAWASIHYNRSDWERDGAKYWEPQTAYTALHQKIRGDGNYTFTMKNASFIPSLEAEEYYVVQYITPNAGNVAAAGYDIGSSPTRLFAIKAAERIRSHVVTGRLRLVQSEWEQYGFLLLCPLFHDVNDTTYFTAPGRSRTNTDGTLVQPAATTNLRPMGFIVGVYKMEEMIGAKLNKRFGGGVTLGVTKSLLVLVFSRIGYSDLSDNETGWEYLAGFTRTQTATMNRSDTVAIEQFNLYWKAREDNMEIIANELFCDLVTVDGAGSKWLIVVAVDYGCARGEYMTVPPVPGKSLTRCARCPVNAMTATPGAESIGECLCEPGHSWSAETSLCKQCPFGRFSSYPSREPACDACPAHSTTLSPSATAVRDCICNVDYEMAAGGSCVACHWLYTSGVGDKCELRISYLVVAAVAFLVSLVFAVGFRFIIVLRRRYYDGQRAREAQNATKHRRIVAAISSLARISFNMCIIAFDSFEQHGRLLPHEVVRKRGELLQLDTYNDVTDFLANNIVIFVSHQWLGFADPDPKADHYHGIVEAVKKLCHMEGLDYCNTYLWVDYLSIPQANDVLKGLAINTLAVYASTVQFFLIVAPTVCRTDTGGVSDASTYQRRGWCRLEQWARMSFGGTEGMYLFNDANAPLVSLTDNTAWLRDSIRIFDADYTVEDDKYKIVDIVLGVFAQTLYHYQHASQTAVKYRLQTSTSMILSNQDEIFPTEYFDDLVAKVEEQVGKVKDNDVTADTAVSDALAKTDSIFTRVSSISADSISIRVSSISEQVMQL